MSHIPYAAEHPDDDLTWHADGSSLDRVFAERDRFRLALQQIAAAGPMFSPDDWRWKVAQEAIKSAHVNGTQKREHDREDVLTCAAPVSDDDVAEIFGAPV